ncbi:MAG: hypothetical protein MHMPM18_001307 [Marteilia pararefringens]
MSGRSPLEDSLLPESSARSGEPRPNDDRFEKLTQLANSDILGSEIRSILDLSEFDIHGGGREPNIDRLSKALDIRKIVSSSMPSADSHKRVSINPFWRENEQLKLAMILILFSFLIIRIDFLNLPPSSCYSPSMLMPSKKDVLIMRETCYIEGPKSFHSSSSGNYGSLNLNILARLKLIFPILAISLETVKLLTKATCLNRKEKRTVELMNRALSQVNYQYIIPRKTLLETAKQLTYYVVELNIFDHKFILKLFIVKILTIVAIIGPALLFFHAFFGQTSINSAFFWFYVVDSAVSNKSIVVDEVLPFRTYCQAQIRLPLTNKISEVTLYCFYPEIVNYTIGLATYQFGCLLIIIYAMMYFIDTLVIVTSKDYQQQYIKRLIESASCFMLDEENEISLVLKM